jgi:hypothetical protein
MRAPKMGNSASHASGRADSSSFAKRSNSSKSGSTTADFASIDPANQVERYCPPPNFAKEADTRYAAYAEQFGARCWELDALDPTVIANLIRSEVDCLIDATAWNSAKAQEDVNRALLSEALRNWGEVEDFLGNVQ